MDQPLKPPAPSPWIPVVTAFTVWFAHFMTCWVAGEIWPHHWRANVWAWAATVIALLALAAHGLSVRSKRASGALSGWSYRFAQGAIALGTTGVLFSAIPSAVFLPVAAARQCGDLVAAHSSEPTIPRCVNSGSATTRRIRRRRAAC
jgi:hypothetical protein